MIASKQIAENYVETGRKKAELPVSHMLILGFFAGMFIALAGAGASVASAAMTNASASRIASALVFPAGLALVVCTGAELFTGNCLMTISALQKRISVGGLFKNLLFVYLGNLIGAIFVAVLFVYGHIPSLYGSALAQVLLNTAVSKVTLTLPEVLCRAVLCNVLVCIAVWAAMSSEQVSGKILALYPPVAIFILCGFEHCIANMFYIPAGLMIMGEYGQDRASRAGHRESAAGVRSDGVETYAGPHQEQQQDGQDFPGRQVRQTARLLSVDRRIPAPCRMGKWRAGGDQLGG